MYVSVLRRLGSWGQSGASDGREQAGVCSATGAPQARALLQATGRRSLFLSLCVQQPFDLAVDNLQVLSIYSLILFNFILFHFTLD